MNQFLSNKIVAGLVAVALLVGVGILVSSGDISSTTRNAALVAATPCTKPGQVTKVSKQAVVCAALSPKNIWYPIFKEKKWICAKLGITRKQNGIFSVCGKNKLSKKRWFLTKPLMASSAPGLPTTDQDAFIKLTTNPELIVETSPTTPLALAPTTETTLAPTLTTTIPQTTTPASTTTTTSPKTCVPGGACTVGDIGPGGGIVFYDAGDEQTWGRYLEAAITSGTTWNPTTKAKWGCKDINVMTSLQRTASLEIGSGKDNTKMITDKNCTGTDKSASAAGIAASYNGGGKADWFLPSRKELDALCHEFFKGGTGTKNSVDNCMGSGNENAVEGTTNGIAWSFAADFYWSSSEHDADDAWRQNFSSGKQLDNVKTSDHYVRPVRAF